MTRSQLNIICRIAAHSGRWLAEPKFTGGMAQGVKPPFNDSY